VELLPNDLNPDRVIVAIVGDQLAGFAGLAYGGQNFMTFKRRDFDARFGRFGGAVRYFLYAAFSQSRLGRDLVVDGLGVTQSLRRRGIGAELLRAVCDYAKANGFGAVRLEVADTNHQARRLYERAGFSVVRTRTNPGYMRIDPNHHADIEMCREIM
jgi:ribosomal protein S18 acetylase RimI-like enzyme